MAVLSAIAIIPSAPVLVPELATSAAAEVADLRDAVFAAAASLPPRWIAIGSGPSDTVVGGGDAGTFAGYGAGVEVRFAREAPGPVADLPLCALVTGWVRGQVMPDARAEVRVFACSNDADTALALGARLRADIDDTGEPVGVLVVADGAHTLTPAAPGGYDPASVGIQHALDAALARGDVVALRRLPESIVGKAAFSVLCGLVESAPRSAKGLYRGAPYGVGYFVGVWLP